MVAAEAAIVKISSLLVFRIDTPVVKFDPEEEDTADVQILDRVILVEFMCLVRLCR
jgi:hypothetical protein